MQQQNSLPEGGTPRPHVSEAHRAQALAVSEITGHPYMDCRKALVSCDHDVQAAVDFLETGQWMRGKLISWDHDSLRTKSTQLAEETGSPYDSCLHVLKCCNGNLERARLRLVSPSR